MIHIIGGGALGLLFAGKLAQEDAHQVLLITRTDEQCKRILTDGVRIVQGGGSAVARLNAASMESNYVQVTGAAQADWVLITVKQQHIQQSFLDMLRRAAHPNTNWIWMQNGMRPMEELQTSIPGFHWLAVTTEAAYRSGMNEVEHTGSGKTIMGIALPPNDRQMKQYAEKYIGMLIRRLEMAGFQAALSNNIMEQKWRKLAVNSIINPLTAVLKIRNGALLDSDYLRGAMRSLFEEIAAVACAEGINLGGGMWEQVLDVCRTTSQNYSSTLQDLMNGRSTEIDWMNGYVIERARMHGMDVPVHQMMFKLVKGLEVSSHS